MIDLEALLPADHRARLVWSFVESLDLSPLYDQVRSREGEAGRPAADPAVLLSLWLYATIEGVGSARELERLAQSHVAYRWLAGGVPLNYHGLADFRVEQVEVLDRLLTQNVTALIGERLMTLSQNAADGTKEGVIVAIEVTDRRNDAGLAGPMVDDIARRYGKAPDRLLIDTSYATSEDIIALAAHAAGAVSVYTPPPGERDDVKPATLARRIRK